MNKIILILLLIILTNCSNGSRCLTYKEEMVNQEDCLNPIDEFTFTSSFNPTCSSSKKLKWVCIKWGTK